MLALTKLGSVIMPTTTAVTSADLLDRLARGNARAVVCNPEDAAKFEDVPGDYLRVAVGEVEGWIDHRAAYQLKPQPVTHPGNSTDDRLLLYFTSGTTSRPKLVEHTHRSYPVGHLTTPVLAGAATRRHTPQHFEPWVG